MDNIRVKFDAFPDQEIPAEIKEVATEASQTTRTYAVNLIMDQPEGIKVLPGMTGKATGDIIQDRQEEFDALFVPVSAVFSPDGADTYVWIIDPDAKTVSRRAVKTGPLANTGIPVKEGLEAGAWIAIAGVHYLEEGQQVEIMEQRGD